MIAGLFAPEQASTIAGKVDALTIALTVVTGVIAIGFGVLIVWFAVRYRRRPGRPLAQHEHTNIRTEISWAVGLLVISMGMFGWGAVLYVEQSTPPVDALDVSVIGKQWMWRVEHPGGRREVNELHVPVGRPVRVTLISKDVIHSFFVPAFRIKQDVLPGRYTTIWFEATRTGTFHLFCTEYCGTAHSEMRGQVIVMKPADYEAWLAGATPEAAAESGEQLFKRHGCWNCHFGAGRRAPSLGGVYGATVRLADGTTVKADDNYLRESILAPRAKVVAGYDAIMPTYKGRLTEEELLRLVAYVKSLGGSNGEDAR